MKENLKLGLIAGNGSFPLLLAEAARAQGHEVIVAAIKEETSPEIERRGAAAVHWLSLGELGKLISTFKAAGVSRAVMAGQVKHKQIFSAIRPDWRMAKLLLSLRSRNTDSLIGAVAAVLAEEGITLVDSSEFLRPLLAPPGVLTRRGPSPAELEDIAYGRALARHLAQYDIGQTVVIAAGACVAVEAMEGTDATIERAGSLLRAAPAPAPAAAATKGPDAREESTFLSRSLTVVKIAKPNQDMRFDLPVVGLRTLEVMHAAGATCLALDAGKCLLLERDQIPQRADELDIAITAS